MKKIFVLMVLTFQGISLSFGQVGVNTATPDSTAALDIQSPPGGSDNRGVLFPRMSTVQRTGIVNPAKSLMVFDTTDMLLYYYDGGRWLGLVPKEPIGTSGAGTPLVNGDITLTTGTISAPNLAATTVTTTNVQATNVTTNNLNVAGFSSNALVPTGAILMWSGNPALIPSGWGLCDGTAGRPDLRGRFIVGYDNTGSSTPPIAPNDGSTTNYGQVGNKGGETGHLLTSGESGLPAHSHTSPPHSHGYADNTSTNDANRGTLSGGAADANEYDLSRTTNGTAVTIDPVVAANAAQVHENRPPYFVLAYIIKLP